MTAWGTDKQLERLREHKFVLGSAAAKKEVAEWKPTIDKGGGSVVFRNAKPYVYFALRDMTGNCGCLILSNATCNAGGEKGLDLYLRNIASVLGYRTIVSSGCVGIAGKALEDAGWTSNWAQRIHGSREKMNYCSMALSSRSIYYKR